MPAPTAPTLKAAIEANLPVIKFPLPYTPYFDLWLSAVSSGVASAWSTWASGLTGGGNSVTGAGIGAWAGAGAGGTLTQGSVFTTTITMPTTTPTQTQLRSAISTVLAAKFALYASTFVFGSVSYVGASTATPFTPGAFTATNTSAPLSTLKASATTPSGISTAVQALLTPPLFDIAHPLCKMPDFLGALETAILTSFTTWEASPFSGDTVTGVAAISTGLGSATSAGTGVIS